MVSMGIMHYLSIDIDFWLKPAPAVACLERVIQYAKRCHIPIQGVMNHQQMLREVNASVARRLVNIDEHSDLTDSGVFELECGTWVSYVKWRHEGSYLWIRNNQNTTYGSCNNGCWGVVRSTRVSKAGVVLSRLAKSVCVRSKRTWDSGNDWQSVHSRHGAAEYCVDSYLNRDLAGVGICLSPAYAVLDVFNAVRPILRGLPYRKGSLDDQHYLRHKPALTVPRLKQALQHLPGVIVRGATASNKCGLGYLITVETPPEHHAEVWRRYPSAGGWRDDRSGNFFLTLTAHYY